MKLIDSQPHRLAVVGLGDFGSLHAATIDRLPECQLAAVVDHDPKRLAKARRRWPHAVPLTDTKEADRTLAIDGWIIASTSDTHVPIAREILASGGKVLIEKPLAESLSEAERLDRWVASDSSNVMLGHIVLFGTEFRQLLKQARNRLPIRFIDAVRHRPSTTLDTYPGENPFHLTMIHDLYCVQVLMSGSDPVSFSSHTHRDSAGRINLALARLQWEDGSIASLTASFLTPPGMPADGFDRVEVFGHDWAARISPNPRPIELWDEAPRHPMTLEIDEDSATGMLAEQLRCFCRVLAGDADVPAGATFQDALQVQRWLQRLSEVTPMSETDH